MHKKLFSDFQKLAYRISYSDTLNVIVNSILLPVCIGADEYYKIDDPIALHSLNDKERILLKEILFEIGNLMEHGLEPIGDLFMEFVSKGKNGQYFTPMHICDFMHQLIFGDIITENSKPKNVSDPACGSGRMLLAAAVPNKNLHCYGTDIDDQCCRMAAANMILHNLVADIACGNELSMKFSHGYIIRRMPGFNFPTLQIVKYVADQGVKPQPAKMILPNPQSEQEKWTQGSLF